MAHIAVHLQRTPQGLHPASAVALCWARDIGSTRGASVTAVCMGDAGSADEALVEAAGRFGADVLLFCGPKGLSNLRERLNPVHVLVPYTPEGIALVEGRPEGPLTPRWIRSRTPPFATADAVTAVVAGVLPWHRFETDVEAEYEGNVDAVKLPQWASSETPRPVFEVHGGTPVGYVADEGLDPLVAQKLRALGAEAVSWEDAPHKSGGTTLLLPSPGEPLHDSLDQRDAHGRLFLLPGPDATLTKSWAHADWVLPGHWADVIATLQRAPGAPWSSASP